MTTTHTTKPSAFPPMESGTHASNSEHDCARKPHTCVACRDTLPDTNPVSVEVQDCTDQPSPSSQQIARQHEQTILRYMHQFGYLNSAQIGELIFTNARQSLRLSQRILKRMTDEGLLLRQRPISGGHVIFGLSAMGARQLSQQTGIYAVSAKDLIRHPSSHREAANWAAIWLIRNGWKHVWTERQIQTLQAPFKEYGGKIPDTLAADEEGEAIWVEVENCVRGGRDLTHIAAWLTHVAFPDVGHMAALDPPHDKHWLLRVRFVLSVPAAYTFPERLQRQLIRDLGNKFDAGYWENKVEFQSTWEPKKIVVGFRR